ncbi:MAG: MarR family transcriptional regulator [Clostridiaceae bacterium]
MNFAQLHMLLKLGREFGHEQIRDAGFTDTEHAICTFLCFHDQVSQDAIANALMLDKTTVAKALNAMESKGLIFREQNVRNRRENIIQISEAGKTSVSASIHVYDAWLSDICSCLSSEERQQLDDSFNKMIDCALNRREKAKADSAALSGAEK